MPEDKDAYVGERHAPAMDVELTKDGTSREQDLTAGSFPDHPAQFDIDGIGTRFRKTSAEPLLLP